MRKTKFPYENIDYDKYFNAYMEREDAVRSLPSKEELTELARKGLLKDHMVLVPLNPGEKSQIGDTLTLKTKSRLPKYNKEKVTVSIGRGLYNKELEEMAAGRTAGESYQLDIQGEPVSVTVLEIKRKQMPELPTDDMAEALQIKDPQGKLIRTVEEYTAYICQEKTMEALAVINYNVMEKLIEDYPVTEFEEEDIRVLGDLEYEYLGRIYKEQDGIDVEDLTKEEAQEKWHCDSFADFIRLRYEWYKIKIQQCLILSHILGVADEPRYDYTDHYEVLSELTDLMFKKLESRLKGQEQ